MASPTVWLISWDSSSSSRAAALPSAACKDGRRPGKRESPGGGKAKRSLWGLKGPLGEAAPRQGKYSAARMEHHPRDPAGSARRRCKPRLRHKHFALELALVQQGMVPT